MNHQPVQARLITSKGALLVLLMAVGAYAAFIRYSQGLGASTNLSDQYPWGLWIGVDVMSGVALAAGGFIAAALVYLFGGDKYYPLVRPAVLTGLLGYAFVGIGLLVDLALPWHIWHAVIYWPEHSVMFEVAWCVMLYLTVLGLEFAQPVLERFGLTGKTMTAWRLCSNGFAVVALSFFVGAMSLSWQWAAVTLVFTSVLATVLWRIGPRRPGVPIMLIVAGVILSTMHQSSLGTMLVVMGSQVNPLWQTPLQPVIYLLTAIVIGYGVVLFESCVASSAYRLKIETHLLDPLAKIMLGVLALYLVVRVADLTVRGAWSGAFAPSWVTVSFWVENLGFIAPFFLIGTAQARRNPARLFLAGLAIIVGGVLLRLNGFMIGYEHHTGTGWSYFPSLGEIMVTTGMFAIEVLGYIIITRRFPVLPREAARAVG